MDKPVIFTETDIPYEYLGTSGSSIGFMHPAFDDPGRFTPPINIMVDWLFQNDNPSTDLLFCVIENLSRIVPKVNRNVIIESEKIESFLDIDRQISALENNAGIVSSEFYSKWLRNEMPDTFENNAWALLIEARNKLLGY